jgi:L-asparaginase II
MSVPVAYVVRSGLVEGTHFGSAVVVDAQGKVEWSIGDVSSAMFPRSSNKLMQGLAMVRNGLPLKNELLALACASHSGEDFHLAGVQDILNAANLGTDSLKCPPDYPLDEIERDTFLAEGLGKASLYMNCSGKHSAMLFTSVLNGWDTETYLKPNHPLQVACRETIESVTGEKVEHIGVDGCGAPLMSMSLTGLARSFSQFSGPAADANQKKIATAIKENPQYLGGTRRDVTQLVAKDGAEAVYGIGLGDGRALALKIEDGADRARIVVAMSVLQKVLGVVSKEVERQLDSQELFGGGVHVGKVIPALSI